MDKLMEGPNNEDEADGNFGTGASASCDVTIVFIKTDGTPTTLGPFSMGPSDETVILSQGNQRVKAKFNPGTKVLKLKVDKTGSADPIVEAKQVNTQRRYIVTNAGAITNVTVAGVQQFPLTGVDSLYTMVHLA